MEQIVSKYLKYLNIPISQKYCEKLIASHPDYPSMLSIADTLERFGINYKVARIDNKQINKLPFPFLLQSQKENEELILIKTKEDLSAYQGDEDSHTHIILKAEPTQTIADKENETQRSRETFLKVMYAILITATVALMTLSVTQLFNLLYIILVLLAVGGATVGYFLQAKELGIKYEPLEAFCNNGKKSNCDRLLYSDEANIFGRVTFSDTVAIYFLFQFMMLGFLIPVAEWSISFLGTMAIFSLLTIPVIVYSIYLQFIKVKIWCRLCLLVSAILVVQTID